MVAFKSRCWLWGQFPPLAERPPWSGHSCPSPPFHVLGQRLVSPGLANETSSILVESVTRSSTETCYSAIPKASSDASKVTSKGAGLSKAFVGQKSSFLVDCSKAGSNMLLIGVHGPTTPCEEVSMKHVGNQQYNVTYVVKEKGDYVLAVKWGEEHIPGSPFHVTVP